MLEIMSEIENVEDIKKASLILYSVSKNEILNKDHSRILYTMEQLNQSGKDGREKLMLTFDGYDNDEREIYMIPEIRDFVKYIYEQYNHLFYFLTTLEENRALIWACINDIKAIKKENSKDVMLEITYNDKIKKQTIESMLKFGTIINDLDEIRRILLTFI